LDFNAGREVPIMVFDQNADFNKLYESTQAVERKLLEGLDDAEREESPVEPDVAVSADDGRDIPDAPDGVDTSDNEAPLDITKEFIGQSDDTYYYLITSEEEGDRDMMIVDQDGQKVLSAKEMEFDVTNEAIPEFLMKVFQEGVIAQIESNVFTKYILPEILKDDNEDEEELIEPDEVEDEDVNGEEEGSEDEEIVEESIKEVSAVKDPPRKKMTDAKKEEAEEADEPGDLAVKLDKSDDMAELDDEHDTPLPDGDSRYSDEEKDLDAADTGAPQDKSELEQVTELYLRKTMTRSNPIDTNAKTGWSVDFTTECVFRKAGHPCTHCYVENGRDLAKAWIKRLMDEGDMTADDIRKSIETGKYVVVPNKETYNRKFVRPGKELKPIIAGETNFVGPTTAKKVYGRTEYKSGQLQRMHKISSEESIKMLNSSGGLRLYSASDYNPEDDASLGRLFDDADAIGLGVKAITKVPEFIEKWADRVAVVHISIDEIPTKYGAHSNAPTWEEAAKIKADNPHVLIRSVAFTPDEVIEHAKTDLIDIVTPFHGSTARFPKEFAAKIVPMGTRDSGLKTLWARAREELTPEQQKKLCCETGRCATCKSKCGIDINWDKVAAGMDVPDKNESATNASDRCYCGLRDYFMNEQECQCTPDNECDMCRKRRLAGEGWVVGDEEADEMSTHGVYEEKDMIIEMIITDKEGNEVEVELAEAPQVQGEDGEVQPSTITNVSVNGRVFPFHEEFLQNWMNVDGELTEEGLKELALDALSGLDPEEYHALLAAGPGHGDEDEESETSEPSPELEVEAEPVSDEDEEVPFESVNEEDGDDPIAPRVRDAHDNMDLDTHNTQVPEEDEEGEEEDVDVYELARQAVALRPDLDGPYGDLFVDAAGYFFSSGHEDDDNLFYRDNLYHREVVNRHEQTDDIYLPASEHLIGFDQGQFQAMTPEEIADEALDPLVNMWKEALGDEIHEAVKEKKAAPKCSKCGKAHWPFQPCGGGSKKEEPEDDKGDDKPEDDKDETDDKNESMSITESKSMDRLNMLLGS